MQMASSETWPLLGHKLKIECFCYFQVGGIAARAKYI